VIYITLWGGYMIRSR